MKNEKRRILVTGGAGFIASHVAEAYLAAGNDVWVVDDLSSGKRENVPEGATFVEMDVGDPDLRNLFREVRFDLVNHHAAGSKSTLPVVKSTCASPWPTRPRTRASTSSGS